MGTAKVVSLSARPWKVSQLCFEVGGILGQLNAQLGTAATPFAFSTFYAGLGATVAGDPSLLSFDSAGILGSAGVTASTLAALRSEPRKAVLDKAVLSRQNAYYAKFGNAPAIITTINTYYGAGATAKPARLQNLSNLAQQQADQLALAYTADGRTGVVKTTNSTLNAKTITTDSSISAGTSISETTSNATTNATGQSNEEIIGAPEFSSASIGSGFPGTLPAAGGEFGATISTTSGSNSVSVSLQEGSTGETSNQTGSSEQTGSGRQVATGQAYSVETESIVNTDYGYRMPSIESQAQNERAQISLIDQQFAQFMAGQNLPNLATVFQNQLDSIDLSVYQLQIGFLNTLLLSPIAGTVTGIYKNLGDSVRAGEPVVRVEDNTTLLLVATLVYRASIQIGSTVTVKTALFDAAAAPTLTGAVVAVRSRGDDDRWDIVVQCANPLDGGGKPTFPIGYHFDYDNTQVTVT
jgi:biotin carboxyl carrier protein